MDPAMGSDVMRLSDLRDAKVKNLDGKTLGRVHEVHSKGGLIVALTCGAGSWFERLTAKSGGRRIPWECVVEVTRKQVVITSGQPQKVRKPAASRSRQGTRRPSAPRSRR
jgi:sporulation protein YlmC with PRC-barrel domain